MASANFHGYDLFDPEPLTFEDPAVAERAACARAICSRCRFGHPVRDGADGFYHDLNVGNGVFPHRCDASPIWERGRID